MNNELRELLQVVAEGNNDLWNETIEAAQKLLKGGYYGHDAVIENLEERGVKTGFELEKAISQGNWYFQNSGAVDLCPECKVYCVKRFIDGQCE